MPLCITGKPGFMLSTPCNRVLHGVKKKERKLRMLMSKIGDPDFSLGIRVLMSLVGISVRYRIIMITKKL